jgi:hypothetical protein
MAEPQIHGIYLKVEPTVSATQQHITSFHRRFFDYSDETECLMKTDVNPV